MSRKPQANDATHSYTGLQCLTDSKLVVVILLAWQLRLSDVQYRPPHLR